MAIMTDIERRLGLEWVDVGAVEGEFPAAGYDIDGPMLRFALAANAV